MYACEPISEIVSFTQNLEKPYSTGMDTTYSILRSAKHFFCATFISRVSGFCRDMAMAFCLGSSVEVGAFLVAFRLANLFRRLLGEGNLQAGFVPQFESFRGRGFARAVHFYREAALCLTLLSMVVILLCEGFLWSIFALLSPSWQQIASLTMWMLPGLLFICLSGLNQALLQSQKKYFLPAVTPAVFNGVWIVAAIYSKTIEALAIWVTIGAAFQWAISSFYVRREFFGVERSKRKCFSPDCLQLIRLMTLGLMGIAAAQLNSALDAIFARVADLSGPVYLWYAVRLQQLPLALFGLALSGAVLPPLSRAIQNQEMDRFDGFLGSALQRAALLIIPSSFGLIALGGAGLNVLYGHGHFSLDDVQRTLECLWAYAIGLIPSAFVLLLSQAFFAKNLYWIPARASLYAVLINMVLNALFVFVFKWGAVSIALATSLSSILNCYLLMRSLSLSLAPLLVRLCGRLTIASSLAVFLTLMVQYGGFGGLALTGWGQGMQACSLSGLYLGALLGSFYLLRISEGKEL
ncbi:MAG: murein biosynthesis integral membrane protein MurJ, partial [Chlamydiales bacterium]|nr:murein biosynthesis integral membrane protein MurJ [Chlamydiales bacterium]